MNGKLVPEARLVCLAASFNQWTPAACEMKRDASGDWTAAVFLPPGIYPYLFCVDGVWYNDPRDDGRAPSEWGNSYSLKVVV